MKEFEIGVVTKAQGLKGDIRVKLYSDDFTIFNNINYVLLNGKKYKINKKTNRNTFAVLKLEDVNDIDSAEKLKNMKVNVYRDDIKLNEEEYFVNELIGFEVFDENDCNHGAVIAINDFGAGDVYTVKKDDKEFMFVNARGVITEIKQDIKKIIVNKQILSELSV